MRPATLVLLVLLGVATWGQSVVMTPSIPSCLPPKTTVAAVSVRALGSHYCSNSTRDEQLRARLLAEVERGPTDKQCRLSSPRFLECIPIGQEQATMLTRMKIVATMTCDSACVRHNSTLQTLGTLKDNLIYLRAASHQRLAVSLNVGGVSVLMWFFDGHGSIVSSCEGNSTSSGTNSGLLLCDCPLQCDKCGDGYYLPPMSSRCQPCPQGTWRQMGMDHTSCVQCPPNTNTSSFGASAPTDCIAPVCPQGKFYSACGPVCRATCANPTPPEGCPSDCVPGCFCPPNMVEWSVDCVMPSECSSFGPPLPRPPVIVATNVTSGDVTVAIGYDIRVYEGVNITVDCSSLVAAHPQGSIHWLAQPVNPRAVVRNSPEFPLPASSAQLVVPSTSIPNFLQVSFRCEVCTAQCWSNNSIISVVTIPPPPPPFLPPPTLPPPSCPPGRVFKECGSACPPSCVGRALGCQDVCVAGCFCPDGLMEEDGGRCVGRESCRLSNTPLPPAQPEFCRLPQDPGPCSDQDEMFAYNPTTSQCEVFTYGGCLGNDNRFTTQKSCLETCSA